MKIHPPKIQIPDSDPYQFDLFNRKEFGDSLFLLFQNITESSVVCIDSPWGEGKTTFAEMWIKHLENEGKKIIYYNAYENDFVDDPFISFSSEILLIADSFSKENNEIKKLRGNFKKKAISIGKKIITTGTKIGIKAATLGVIKDSDLDAINSIREDLASNSSDFFSKIVENKINNFLKEKNNINSFRDELSKLCKIIKEIQNFPLLIIIDELDRCKPDFALMLIERIKHLFSVDNVSFLILTNIEQLENYVKTVYGSNMDAHNYLHKFFTLSTSLPKNDLTSYDNDYIKFIKYLSNHHGLLPQIQYMDDIIEKLFQYFNFSLREIERFFTIIAIYYSNLTPNRYTFHDLIGFLAIIKVRFPDIFNKLLSSNISFEELNKNLKLDLINVNQYEGYPKERFHLFLKFLLLSENEYIKLDANDPILEYSKSFQDRRIERRMIIPMLCKDLTKFKKT